MSEKPEHDQSAADRDTEAILARRRFLIQSTLAGLGIGAAAAVTGCGDEPKACLEVAPEPKAKPKPEPEPKPCLEVEPEPEPCLSIIEPEPEPKPCLTVPPEEEPKPCLDVAPDDGKAESEPKICLKIAPPTEEKPPKSDRPGICLSIRRVPPKGES
jgi:hypothetical protein